eukprot:2219600-Rhodomonas_salina.1
MAPLRVSCAGVRVRGAEGRVWREEGAEGAEEGRQDSTRQGQRLAAWSRPPLSPYAAATPCP